jgi:tRNA (cmo5U34)-methyltransferase
MGMIIPERWDFNAPTVAEHFDSHVREQLPWYDLATEVTTHIARHYIPQGGLVYDIGASTGNISRALSDVLKERNARIVALENSPPMAALYRGSGEIVVADAETFDYQPFDLAICFLVLMFLSPCGRADLLQRLRSIMRRGGAIIVFDKCVSANGYAGTVMSRLALASKFASGVPPQEIIEKELSLIGVQRPLRADELGTATEFFRYGDFAGWLREATS